MFGHQTPSWYAMYISIKMDDGLILQSGHLWCEGVLLSLWYVMMLTQPVMMEVASTKNVLLLIMK